MPTYMEDRALVRRLLAGDERAFSRFFDDNFARVYRFVLARVNQREDAAAEIAQATLSRALRKLAAYRGEAALFTWLCGIARHELLDWLRRQSHYREHIVLTEDLPEVQAAIDTLLAPAIDEPASHYQAMELTRLIQVALDHLPPRYGNALEWKYIQGFSVKEIATRLDLSPVAAQSLLARAKRAFADAYSALARPTLKEEQA